jgi:hypothetical protein
MMTVVIKGKLTKAEMSPTGKGQFKSFGNVKAMRKGEICFIEKQFIRFLAAAKRDVYLYG